MKSLWLEGENFDVSPKLQSVSKVSFHLSNSFPFSGKPHRYFSHLRTTKTSSHFLNVWGQFDVCWSSYKILSPEGARITVVMETVMMDAPFSAGWSTRLTIGQLVCL